MNTGKLYLWVKILAVVGILLSTYLLYEQNFRPSFNPCNISATVNCDAIISGPVAKTLGIPTPLYGLIGYVIILLAAIFSNKKLILGMATFGLLFCLWIAYQELFLLHVICPLCIACQLLMISVFIVGLIICSKDKKKAQPSLDK